MMEINFYEQLGKAMAATRYCRPRTKMRSKALFFAATALLASAGASAGASATTIKFSSFDQIANPPRQGGFTIYNAGTVIDGWTAGANGLEIQRGAAGAPFSNPNLVEVDTSANSSM